MNAIDQSEAAHRGKCRHEMTELAKVKKPRVTKKDIVREIRLRHKTWNLEVNKTFLGKGQILLECNHGDCERIGQFVLQYFPKQVYTYFACHIFRRGHLAIYFKR
jgi:hypothetical protein